MSKRLIALGAALFASVAPIHTNARVTGFYVGIQGGVDLAQFKLYDGTSHQGTSATWADTKGTQYGDNNETGDGTPATVTIPSVTKASDDFEATPEYIYKVRPAGEIFIGYNYQVGSNFVVGVEVKGGLTFGSHKYSASTRLPDLTCYTRSDDGTTLVDSSDKQDLAYFKGQYKPTQFELDTKFSGDLSLRLGCVVPGTDGRLAVFLRGGVGFVRQELTFKQASGDLYYEAIVNAALRGAKMAVAGAETDGAFVSAALMHDLLYVTWPFTYIDKRHDGAQNQAAIIAAIDGVIDNTPGNDPRDIGAGEIARFLLKEGATAEYGLVDQARGKIKDLEANETKSRFTCHVGGDLEYHFANGLFVRASYTFKYIKGFFAEKSQNVTSLTKAEAGAAVAAAVQNGAIDRFLKNLWYGSDGRQVVLDDQQMGVVKNLLVQGIPGVYDDCPDSLSLGSLNTKVGTHEKSFSHQFTFGIGFKFCM